MNRILISDLTLKDRASNGNAPLSFKEKVETVKLLDRMCVNSIELAPIENEKADSLFVRTVVPFLSNSIITLPVGRDEHSIEVAANALSRAEKARLQVSLPVSPIQMEYVCHKKPEPMLEHIKATVEKCRSFVDDVEFCAEDATRSEKEFLCSALETAIEAGATVITLCDTEGHMLPCEFSEFIKYVQENVKGIDSVTLSVSCCDDMNMSVACSAAAIDAGVRQIKTSVCDGKYAKLGDISHFIVSRGNDKGFDSSLDITRLGRLSEQIRWIISSQRGRKSPFDGAAKTQPSAGGAVFDGNDSIDAIKDAVVRLGYELSDEDNEKVYESFKTIAASKTVTDAELEAIVASVALQVPPTYVLDSYVINSGNKITATANVLLLKNGAEQRGISVGDGPIDASFLAIEQIVGHHYELDDFQIQSVTEGRDSMGSALIKLRAGGKLYSGNGISTDIVGASIHAYINALNKIVYEEDQI